MTRDILKACICLTALAMIGLAGTFLVGFSVEVYHLVSGAYLWCHLHPIKAWCLGILCLIGSPLIVMAMCGLALLVSITGTTFSVCVALPATVAATLLGADVRKR